MPRFLIAPQEFKGSLTAPEAAAAIAAGVRDASPAAAIELAPMSDGGAGLVEALLASRGGERVATAVLDPLLRRIDATWAVLPEGLAAVEMAAASGLVLLAPDERAPLVASTFGTGQLLRAAVERGCREIVVGVGGSATVDGGAGALQALGARLVDEAGRALPPGGASLARLVGIDIGVACEALAGVRLRVATDVRNRLCGDEGAARIFGPQKGATPADVAQLDAALARFAAVTREQCAVDLLALEGGGAAGGLAAGLHLLGASIEPGFTLVADAVALDARVARADIVITGEGRLDSQTLYGKTAAGVAARARAQGKLVLAVAGSIEDERAASMFDVAAAATPPGMSLAAAMRDAASLVRAAAGRAVRTASDSGRIPMR
ncbi:MAG: glycerate kinase [Dehalococcoidia bacterium]|nr:glycerate kinase [Dehalococcoidia bacterium]